MNLIERVTHIQAVWRMVLPHLTAPAPTDVARWLEHSDKTIEAAIVRTAGKFAPSKIDASFDVSRAWRYVTSTARMMESKTDAPARP